VIVLDPGHGGIDPGAVGKKGLYEKDITLNICGHLQKLFEDSMGVKALLTREEDVYFSLKGRTGFANNHSADLFISVHCNAAPRNKNSCGFETYFLSEAKTTEARAAAALENASLKFDGIEPTDEVTKILYDLAQSSYLEESNILAEFIQTSAENNVSVPSRGISQAGFYVLRGAFMPAVLVETAFISNLEEEKLLKTTEFQKKLAYSIFKGTREFIADYERRMNN
jgi:N-acetylmuramoyl-L-alanine amidase